MALVSEHDGGGCRRRNRYIINRKRQQKSPDYEPALCAIKAGRVGAAHAQGGGPGERAPVVGIRPESSDRSPDV